MTTYAIFLGYNSCNTGAPLDDSEQWTALVLAARSVTVQDVVNEMKALPCPLSEEVICETAEEIIEGLKVYDLEEQIRIHRCGEGHYEYGCRALVRCIVRAMHAKGIEVNLCVG